MKTKVKCGYTTCNHKETCSHYPEHDKTENCEKGCIRCNKVYKCYNIAEQRKIKLNKIKEIDN